MENESQDIKIRSYPERGQVIVTCGAESFARIWAAVAAELGPIEGGPPVVRAIMLEKQLPPRQDPWFAPFALLGCGLIGFVILFVMYVGVQTIAGWMW